MSKIESITNIIETGIKAEALRQKAIASNIANSQTPGYRRYDIQFEQALQRAVESGDIESEQVAAELFQPLNTEVNSKGNDVNLEIEVGKMVKNSLRHRAYIQLLHKKYEQVNLALNV